MRLTKRNPETGLYEYHEKAKTQAEYNEQRKAVIQKLGEYEDKQQGKWLKDNNKRVCSECAYIYYSNEDNFNYCPNCGAKMKGE